jgi:hypothetical protein
VWNFLKEKENSDIKNPWRWVLNASPSKAEVISSTVRVLAMLEPVMRQD